jgi:hypothetical protein
VQTSLMLMMLLFSAPQLADPSCPFQTIQTGGVADAFVLPADTTHRSPGLVTFLSTRNPKDYDDLTIDRHFGDSFKLDECLICDSLCSARVEIELQGTGGLDCNDSIFIGEAGGVALWSGPIYFGGCFFYDDASFNQQYNVWRLAQSPSTTRTIDLDVKALQDLVCNKQYPWLDVVVQDDHGVDSIKLVLEH